MLQPGQVLSNGAIVIASKPYDTGHIVLCIFRGEYVTWKCRGADDPYAGHYHPSYKFSDAVLDFNTR